MKKIGRGLIVIAIVIGALFAAYYAYQYAVESPYRVSPKEAKRRLQAKQVDLLLDVRTDLERRTLGFYPGSVHIQSADLRSRISREYPDKKIRILAYCNTGHRARAAADTLHSLGYTNAVYIATTYKSLL
jgi:rhodanese-related sulfurtransferase